jgi:hypothetical protein
MHPQSLRISIISSCIFPLLASISPR